MGDWATKAEGDRTSQVEEEAEEGPGVGADDARGGYWTCNITVAHFIKVLNH